MQEHANPHTVRSTQQRQRYARRIARVIKYIDRHLDDDLSLDKLARVAHFSPFHFHRQFSAYTGETLARVVRLMRLRRASMRLAFLPDISITDIAFEAGYDTAESFSRAFRQVHGQSPSQFRRAPMWKTWQRQMSLKNMETVMNTEVEIVNFPTTRVAAVEYTGPEMQSLSATRRLIEWRRINGVAPGDGATYGIHYSDPATTEEQAYRLDLCVSYDLPVKRNPQGVIVKSIPGGKCARIRHLGGRDDMPEVAYLYREWLPNSGEALRDFPVYFHYVNVGPDVVDSDMVTDIYLPLR